MKTYEVMITVPCYAYLTISADSPEEAKRIAEEESVYELQHDYDCSTIEVTETE